MSSVPSRSRSDSFSPRRAHVPENLQAVVKQSSRITSVSVFTNGGKVGDITVVST